MYQNSIYNQINQWIEEYKEVVDASFSFIDEELDKAFDLATSGELIQSVTGFSLTGNTK